jgi:hypothetical protein
VLLLVPLARPSLDIEYWDPSDHISWFGCRRNRLLSNLTHLVSGYVYSFWFYVVFGHGSIFWWKNWSYFVSTKISIQHQGPWSDATSMWLKWVSYSQLINTSANRGWRILTILGVWASSQQRLRWIASLLGCYGCWIFIHKPRMLGYKCFTLSHSAFTKLMLGTWHGSYLVYSHCWRGCLGVFVWNPIE